MKLVKQDVGIWIKAIDELPPIKKQVIIKEFNGRMTIDSASKWDKSEVDYSWLTIVKDRYVLTESELQKLKEEYFGMGIKESFNNRQ